MFLWRGRGGEEEEEEEEQTNSDALEVIDLISSTLEGDSEADSEAEQHSLIREVATLRQTLADEREKGRATVAALSAEIQEVELTNAERVQTVLREAEELRWKLSELQAWKETAAADGTAAMLQDQVRNLCFS